MKWTILFAAVFLVACDRTERPQGPTEAETERLNDAEEMLNDLAHEEGAAPEGTAPPVNSN
jgi:hypothetical protein